MCLIILNPSGEKLPQSALENGWHDNPHGAGYMFVAGGKLVIRKPYHKLKLLLADLRADHAAHGASSPFVVHFRFATHGEKTAENCHPHPVCGGQIGLVHNGILRDFLPPFMSDHSDTVHFCRTVLAYRSAVHVIDETFRKILAEMIGTTNKFVLLIETGEVSIVNESAGTWDNGNWYSNDSYKSSRVFSCNIPARYLPATADLFGRRDVWDEARAESTADELDRIERELDAVDWQSLTCDEREHYEAMCYRMIDLENELDARLH